MTSCHGAVVAIVVGVRPHFIKAAALLRWMPSTLDSVLIHTGQHYDAELSAAVMNSVGLRDPDHQIHVGSGSSPGQVGQGIMQLEPILCQIRPSMTIVIGDANSSLIGALASAQLGIPVCHVEAGVSKPEGDWIAEEINRRIIDSIATLGLTPTRTKADRFRRSIRHDKYRRARFGGDLLLDQMVATAGVARADDLADWAHDQRAEPHLLVTLHRPETVNSPVAMKGIIESLTNIDLPVEFCLHPRTEHALRSLGLLDALVTAPLYNVRGSLDHNEIARAIARAHVVVTDSSGVQRESYFLGTPCAVVRDATEYPETLTPTSGILVDPESHELPEEVTGLIGGQFRPDYREFGNGTAAARIIKHVLRTLDSTHGGHAPQDDINACQNDRRL